MNDMVSRVTISLQESVIQGLEDSGNYLAYSIIENRFNLESPLASLQTEHQRTKYYEEFSFSCMLFGEDIFYFNES